jgi:multisubunit Na+/H+ antiporter MnhF subunit
MEHLYSASGENLSDRILEWDSFVMDVILFWYSFVVVSDESVLFCIVLVGMHSFVEP